MTDRERDTLPEGLAPPSQRELDTGADVIKRLFDENLTPFLERQSARDEKFHQLVERFMDQSLINSEDMKRIQSEICELKDWRHDTERRLREIENRLNG
jgi:hypothetical protein